MSLHPLKDKRIVITRPKHQAINFAENLQKVGGYPLFFPLIEITPLDNDKTRQQLLTLSTYDLIIFISVNAVENLIRMVGSEILKNKVLVTVGKKSARALSSHGLTVDYCPEKYFNSEALLSLAPFKMAATNKKIAIIRGSEGRDYLKNNLTKLGAQVDYMDVYTRHCPQPNLNELFTAHDNAKIDVVILTSASSTASFFGLASELSTNYNYLNEMSILMGSERMQHEIPDQFKGNILIAEDPSDESLFNKLTENLNK